MSPIVTPSDYAAPTVLQKAMLQTSTPSIFHSIRASCRCPGVSAAAARPTGRCTAASPTVPLPTASTPPLNPTTAAPSVRPVRLGHSWSSHPRLARHSQKLAASHLRLNPTSTSWLPDYTNGVGRLFKYINDDVSREDGTCAIMGSACSVFVSNSLTLNPWIARQGAEMLMVMRVMSHRLHLLCSKVSGCVA